MKKGNEVNKRYIIDIHTHSLDSRNAIVNYNIQPFIIMHVPSYERRRPPMFIVGIVFIFVTLFNTLISCSAPFLKGYFYSLGLHPWELLNEGSIGKCRLFKRMFTERQVIAIGEAGLDKLAKASMELQIELFIFQVTYAEAIEKPMIIHCVKATDELLAIRKEMNPKQPWIWHGFRGKPEQAKQLLKQGFYLSFGEHYPEETMAVVPDDRLFLETDKSTVSIETLLEKAAKVRGVEVDVLREIIHENVEKVFFKA